MKLSCTHRPPCPGCPVMNEEVGVSPKLKILQELVSTQGAQLHPVMEGRKAHYRVRARLAVRGRTGNPKIGIFQEHSHRIVDIPKCPIHHPAINEAIAHLKNAMKVHGIAPYVEKPGLGLLRYVQVVVERQTEKVQMTLVVTDESDTALQSMCQTLISEMGSRLQSLWLNENQDRGNKILGKSFTQLFGPAFLTEIFAGRELHFHPAAFGQSNLSLAEDMVRAVDEFVPEGKRILEFHCGVGAIGLGLIEHAASIVMNEISPFGLAGLEKSLNQMTAAAVAKARVIEGPAAQFQDHLESADIVICDPPRKGMNERLVRALGQSSIERLILIYCGFESFRRDLETIVSSKKLALTHILPVALFPHTNHVEVVAVLDRRIKD